MPTPIVGAIIRPQLPPEHYLPAARAAAEAGLAELWLWEDCFAESGLAPAAAILGATERMRVGIGVMPFPLRAVALAAMEVATLERMFPGRLIPGFGHGVQGWMAQAGVRAASPLGLEREYVTALRALLAGVEVTTAGDYVRLDRVRLEWPPATVPGIHLAATGPKSLRVSGEVGDGTVLVSDTAPDAFVAIRDAVLEGRRAAGRAGDHVFTVFAAPAVPTPDGVAATIAEWASVGADRVVLEPAADDADAEAFVRAVAEGARRAA